MVTFIVRRHSEKFIQCAMLLPKVWLSDCVTSRFLRFLCWVSLDLYVHQRRQPSRPRSILFSVPQQARTTLFHLRFLGLVPFVALVLIWWASIPSAWRLPIELQHARPRSAKDLRKSSWLVDTIALLVCSLSPTWENFLVLSMAYSTADASEIVCRLDRDGTLDEVPENNKQKIASGLLLSNFINKTFLGLYPVVDGEPWDRYMRLVPFASRPKLLVDFLHILCNVLCTAQRFHIEKLDNTCRVWWPNESDSLTHYNEFPRWYIFVSFWRHATV